MIIELRGVEFVNKGAELMLHAMLKKVKEKYPQAIIVMQVGAQTPKSKLKQHDIKIKISTERSNRIGSFIPAFIRHKAGYFLEKEIGIVLDGSGFAFGDQWGASYAERRLGSKIVKWRSQNKKIILLSQAFGPFKDALLQSVIKKIILNADLIFAREEKSLKYLNDLHSNGHIIQAPDFTNLLEGKRPKDFDPETHQVAIIPNYKMIESGSQKDDVYTGFLKHCVNETIKCGLKPFFLIHEGKRDHDLAKIVNDSLPQSLDIIVKEDPLEIKGIISMSMFIICSRFHGVVSALSQGVPCIVTSWSHKYAMLVKEYDFEEGLMNDLSDFEAVDRIINKLASPEFNKQLSDQLMAKSLVQKERTKLMWETIYKVIDLKKTA